MAAVFAALVFGALLLRHVRRPERASGDAMTEATPPPYETAAFATLQAERGILVHCGNSMRPAVETIAAEFQRQTGIAVRMNFGGSAELLSTIDLARLGDLYICHDPYAERIGEKNLLDDLETVGALMPIIIVPKGNPLDIASIEDLLRRSGLRLGMPDARYATAARLVREALRARGWEQALDDKLVMESRGHNEVAAALLTGHLDAGIVWNFIAAFYRGRLDGVGTGLDLAPTRVTLCLLTTATDPEAARRFMELAGSEFGREVFRKHGYLLED